MDLSLIALVFILFFVTPALPYVIWFRIFFPRARTVRFNDLSLLLACSMVSIIFSGDLLDNYIYHALDAIKDDIKTAKILLTFFSGDLSLPRPMLYILKLFFPNSDFKTSIFPFLLDLHFRSFVVGFVVLSFFKIIGKMDQYLQALPYIFKYDPPEYGIKLDFRTLMYFLSWVLCYPKTTAHTKQRGVELETSFVTTLSEFIKTAIWHPWNILTKQNNMREVLLVDIKNKDGELFSGLANIQQVIEYGPIIDLTQVQAILLFKI